MEQLQAKLTSANRQMVDITELLQNNQTVLSKDASERIFNEAIKTRERLKGIVIGYNLSSDTKVTLVEDCFLMELRLFDNSNYTSIPSEQIYKYKIIYNT